MTAALAGTSGSGMRGAAVSTMKSPHHEEFSEWGRKGTGDGQFSYPSDVAVARDGTIAVADSNNNRIQCFHSDGTFIRKWGKKGIDDGDFDFPIGLAIGEGNGLNKSIMSTMSAIPEL